MNIERNEKETVDPTDTQETVRKLADSSEFARLKVAEHELEVVLVEGREKISEFFGIEIRCEVVDETVKPMEIIGKLAELDMGDRFGSSRNLQALVAAAETTCQDDGKTQLSLSLRPRVFALSLSRDSRTFIELTVPQIVDRVMEKTAAPHRWELSKDYRERVYTVQYREDDWRFVSRLLEEEGIYYWFDHRPEETVVVFADHSPSSDGLIGNDTLPFMLDAGMVADQEVVYAMGSEAHATATKFTVGSFNPWNPALKVMATEGDGIHEMYDAPAGGPEEAEHCRRQARVRWECAKAHRAGVSGNSNCIRLEPGRRMTVAGHPLLDNTYFVTEVRYRIAQRHRFSEAHEGSFECHFEAIEAELPFRAPEDTPVSRQAGIQTGRVVGPAGEEIHTDERGRVRIQMHWDREGGWNDKAGKWMRVSQRGVSMSMLYPRIGWNVTTLMEEGNVNAPIVLSRLHDAAHPPTYELPKHKTRTTFRTQTTPAEASANELRFEDLSGIQEMFINASRDMNYTVKNDNVMGVDRNHERIVGNNYNLSVAENLQRQVSHDQTWKVGGDEEFTVENTHSKGVEGDEVETVVGNRKLKIGSDVMYAVSKNRKLEVTGNLDEHARKGMFRYSAQSAEWTVGQSVTQTLQGQHLQQVTKDAIRSVGAAKLETCSGSHVTLANRDLTESVSGSMLLCSKRHFMNGADETSQWTVGSSWSTVSPHIHVQAKEKILLKVGGSSITITPRDIHISTPSYELTNSASLVVKTKKVLHNS